ncbi:MAG: hypothetical protein ACYCVV_08205 [Acidimicrobiales bacterium]
MSDAVPAALSAPASLVAPASPRRFEALVPWPLPQSWPESPLSCWWWSWPGIPLSCRWWS